MEEIKKDTTIHELAQSIHDTPWWVFLLIGAVCPPLVMACCIIILIDAEVDEEPQGE